MVRGMEEAREVDRKKGGGTSKAPKTEKGVRGA